MKRYRVVFTEESKQDIANSYEWGLEEWGEPGARRWYLKLKSHTLEILMRFPMSQPLAPETDEAGREIHHMIFGRYRVIFEIVSRTVRVLHVRGAFTGTEKNNLGVEE